MLQSLKRFAPALFVVAVSGTAWAVWAAEQAVEACCCCPSCCS